MDAFDSEAVFDVLRSRGDLLAALDDEAQTPAGLTDELTVSRSTVDRGLRELERVGFVEISGGIARLTLPGRMALGTYHRFVVQLNDIEEVSHALEPLSFDVPFDPVLVAESEVVVSSGPSDERPIERVTSFIEDAASIRGCTRAVFPAHVEVYYRRIAEDAVPVELVVTEDVVERLVTAYRPQLVELYGNESFSLRSIDSLPYGLLVVERPSGPVAVFSIHSSSGLVGVVSNDRPDAVAWARTQIDRQWEDSDPFPATAISEE